MTRTEKKREIRASQVAWLHTLIKATGQSRSALATNSGLASNMLTRFLSPAYSSLLTSATIEQLKVYTGLPGPEGTNNRPLCVGEVRELDADDLPEILRAAVEAVLAKSPNVTVWMIETRAIEAAGWLPGDVVIVDPLQAPKRGEPVFAQAINPRTGAEDIIVRLYEPPFLVPASYDPALRKPTIDDNQHVRICGAVIAMFRGLSAEARKGSK